MMISVEEATQIIKETTPKASIISMPLSESQGKVLASPIVAERDGPPFNRVAMDGIAIDSSAGLKEYKIAGEQAAGSPQMQLPNKESCITVMTGAPLPLGCDCVIPFEKIQQRNSRRLVL